MTDPDQPDGFGPVDGPAEPDPEPSPGIDTAQPEGTADAGPEPDDRLDPVEPEAGTVPAIEIESEPAGPVPFTGAVRPTAARRAPGTRRSRTRSPQAPVRRRVPGVDGVRRLPVIAAIVTLLVVGGLIDRSSPSGAGQQAVVALPQVPVAAPAGALSSSWFCAGGTGATDGEAPASVVIANANPQAITATVRLVGSQGGQATSEVSVPAEGRISVAEHLADDPSWIGADVTLHGGAAAVEQEIGGSLGPSATPCATSGQQNWYFPDGQTTINGSDEITLLNPYPSDAIVDLTFTTDQGVEAPGPFQALVVPASGLVSVDLGSHLRRRTRIATAVSARSGRVVAWETEIVKPVPAGTAVLGPNGPPAGAIDPASPVPGVMVSLGSPSAATSWVWPDGDAGNGIEEQYVIFNPGPRTATVQLALHLDQGSATPFVLTVGAEEVTTVVSELQARVPAGVTHSATLTSLNGVPVVAEREVAAASPSTRIGLGVLAGERITSRDWLFPAGGAGAHTEEWLILYNPAKKPVSAAVDALTPPTGSQPVSGLSSITVAGGARVAIELNAHDATFDDALVVRSSAGLYVERDLYGSPGNPGYGMSAGVPLQP